MDRAFLALRTDLHLEADALGWLRAAMRTAERLDMDKNLLPALHGFDEAKSSIVVPGFDGAFKPHDFSCGPMK
nr:hypothetical protein [Pantoea sp. 18069]